MPRQVPAKNVTEMAHRHLVKKNGQHDSTHRANAELRSPGTRMPPPARRRVTCSRPARRHPVVPATPSRDGQRPDGSPFPQIRPVQPGPRCGRGASVSGARAARGGAASARIVRHLGSRVLGGPGESRRHGEARANRASRSRRSRLAFERSGAANPRAGGSAVVSARSPASRNRSSWPSHPAGLATSPGHRPGHTAPTWC